jgi:hypothetical protein
MSITLEDIEKFLPQYLSSENKNALFEQFKGFPNNLEKLYSKEKNHEKTLLQADVMCNVPIIDLPDTKITRCKVLIISNSCDNDLDNDRKHPISISYVPIIKLKSLEDLLYKQKIDENKIKSFINDVKKQHITNLFYLPIGDFLEEELVACFDKTLNMSRNTFFELFSSDKVGKILSMSNYGFYMFLLKLSIHFTRIREKIDRG